METKKTTTKTNTKADSEADTDVPVVKTSKRATKYVIVGICITIFNYASYSLINFLFLGINPFNMGSGGNSDFLWLSTFISTVLTTIIAFIAHSKITWRERDVTKHSVIRFFIWNAILAVAIGPWLTQLFSFFTPLYELAYNICSTIHLPFSYEFILATGAFALTSLVIMILNFLFYDRFVFGKPKNMVK